MAPSSYEQVEIKKKFDEIVAFAEVEKFLDTPVKTVLIRHVRPAIFCGGCTLGTRDSYRG